jgi:hypothetical protein
LHRLAEKAAVGLMQLDADRRLGHLTYCTNIHAGETWTDIFAGMKSHLPQIKAEVAPDQTFGVGLRLSAAAARSLQDETQFAEFDAFLRSGGYSVFTLNGFPYGVFHGQPVKEGAYRPDWSDPARLDYTNIMANHLARWLPEGMQGSISTVPGTFKAWATGEARAGMMDAITGHIVQHVAHLVDIERRTGKRIHLALEPEPFCLIETIDETLAFYKEHLFGASAVAQLARLSGMNDAQAGEALRSHVGVCYDVCHAAVEFEDPKHSLDALLGAGITISKLQLSSAMCIARVDRDGFERLKAMDEPIYMHQVIENRNGTIRRFADIPHALAAYASAQGSEWRIHFHVPIFLDEMQHLGTTQQFLKDVLAIHRKTPVTQQLEVETYTWDVLPENYRTGGLSAAIARELQWVKGRLLS